MPKRQLDLPTKYVQRDIKSYFLALQQRNNSNNNSQRVEGSDTESDIDLSYYPISNPPSSFKRITKRIEDESENENGVTLSQELEQDFEIEQPVQQAFKRLRKNTDYDLNNNNASPPVSSDEESFSEDDYSSDSEQIDDDNQIIDVTADDSADENEFIAEEGRRLRDNGWLQRVTTHLLPRSHYQPPPQDRTNYGKIFLELKKEWGYKLGKFRTLNQGECSMCGHSPVVTLFTIKNIHTQRKTETGSTCIKQFQVFNNTNSFYSKGQSLRMIKNDISYANSERNEETRSARRFIW